MIPVSCDLADLPLHTLVGPLSRAEDLLARLDERVRSSPVRDGFVERQHFADAAAALWLEGELIHLEDLVLHDARMDIRTPTHELTRAHAVLRARRLIFAQKPYWALSRSGLQALRGREDAEAQSRSAGKGRGVLEGNATATSENDDQGGESVFNDHDDGDAEAGARAKESAEEFAEIDALLARTQRVLAGEVLEARRLAPSASNEDQRNPLIFDLDWNEDERLAEWTAVIEQTLDRDMPNILAAALAWEAWESKEPLQHQAWLGNLLVPALLREGGKVASHLLSLSAGLRTIPRERRKSRDRTTRLLAFFDAVAEAASAGLKEIERLAMAKRQMERRLSGRRKSSKLPALIDLVLARPIVSAGIIAKELKVSQRGGLNLIGELGAREMTGRGRYRAWGVI